MSVHNSRSGHLSYRAVYRILSREGGGGGGGGGVQMPIPHYSPYNQSMLDTPRASQLAALGRWPDYAGVERILDGGGHRTSAQLKCVWARNVKK